MTYSNLTDEFPMTTSMDLRDSCKHTSFRTLQQLRDKKLSNKQRSEYRANLDNTEFQNSKQNFGQ